MMPIFIITCDRLEVLKESIQSYHDCIKTPFEIVIIDFGSTYKPTLEYLKGLEQEKVKVYREKKISRKDDLNNSSGIIQDYFKDRPASNYVVTDPDIALENTSGDVLEVYAHLLENFPETPVVGPMLRTDDLPDHYPMKEGVIRWERKINSKPINTIQYKGKIIKFILTRIDTTFGMNRAGTLWRRSRGAFRVLPPYMAKHLNWYVDPDNLTQDQKYYREHASRGIGHSFNWDQPYPGK